MRQAEDSYELLNTESVPSCAGEDNEKGREKKPSSY